jgi:hypothetical protein
LGLVLHFIGFSFLDGYGRDIFFFDKVPALEIFRNTHIIIDDILSYALMPGKITGQVSLDRNPNLIF